VPCLGLGDPASPVPVAAARRFAGLFGSATPAARSSRSMSRADAGRGQLGAVLIAGWIAIR
jgi:hypothetical protein